MNVIDKHKEPKATNLSKSEIEQIAVAFADRVGFKPGDDLKEVVDRMGGCISYLDWEDWLAHDHDTILIEGPRKFTIKLLGVDGGLRNNFTIAHELGHYLLHSMSGRLAPMIAGRKGSNRVEWEANWFAASFLMPETEFRNAAVNNQMSDMELAGHFRVSLEAVSIRKKNIGI